ncbi:MAG: hypothetical protein Q9165_006294 [Trypethelium subeluteriae]
MLFRECGILAGNSPPKEGPAVCIIVGHLSAGRCGTGVGRAGTIRGAVGGVISMKKDVRLEGESRNILVVSDEDCKSLCARDARVVAALSSLDSRGNFGGATSSIGWADALGVGSGRIQSTLVQGLVMRSSQRWYDRGEKGQRDEELHFEYEINDSPNVNDRNCHQEQNDE